jgi:hypothetical protein|tara:strand:+ start:1977 stop:2249 length:273 start_codon:yes stop_codon:yes gene_type:complete
MNKTGEMLDKSQKLNNLIGEYKETLNEIEKKALEIAINNLETSFCIEKSVGFLEFISERKKKENDMINSDYVAEKVLSTALGGEKINGGL